MHGIHNVCDDSLRYSISTAPCTQLIYAIAAAPLLVVAACGTDEGLNGRVTHRI